MTLKKQAPVYLVKNDHSREIPHNAHPEIAVAPSVVVLVQEVATERTVDGCRTFREVGTGEIHHNSGEDIYPTQAAALAHCPNAEVA
jgi:hypothetical protein